MPSTVVDFRSRARLSRRGLANQFVQLALALADVASALGEQLPEELVRQRLRLEDEADDSAEWLFVMIGKNEFVDTGQWLADNSCSPIVALKLWLECVRRLDRHSGEIVATRFELAEAVNAAPATISRIMGELERRGAIERRRQYRNSPVKYYLNSNAATHLKGRQRQVAQAKDPPLMLSTEQPVAAE